MNRYRNTSRRGIALILVMLAVAVAAVASYAALGSTALMVRVGDSAAKVHSADCLAESGVNLAMYYLVNPSAANLSAGQSYWTGGTNISLGSTVPGSVDVSVAQVQAGDPKVDPNELTGSTYRITSTGRLRTSGNQEIRRTIHVRVALKMGSGLPHALSAAGDITLNSNTSITGSVYSPGVVTCAAGANVDGTIYSNAVINLPGTASWQAAPGQGSPPAPSSVNHYLSYRINGVSYSATKLGNTLKNVTLGPTSSNPAGIYWCEGNTVLDQNVHINGSLIVSNGQLSVRGNNSYIIARSEFPALIVDKDLNMWKASRTLRVEGVCYLGTGLTRTSDNKNSSLNIIGALLLGPGAAIDPAYNGTISVVHDPTRLNVPDLGLQTAPDGVAVITWGH